MELYVRLTILLAGLCISFWALRAAALFWLRQTVFRQRDRMTNLLYAHEELRGSPEVQYIERLQRRTVRTLGKIGLLILGYIMSEAPDPRQEGELCLAEIENDELRDIATKSVLAFLGGVLVTNWVTAAPVLLLFIMLSVHGIVKNVCTRVATAVVTRFSLPGNLLRRLTLI